MAVEAHRREAADRLSKIEAAGRQSFVVECRRRFDAWVRRSAAVSVALLAVTAGAASAWAADARLFVKAPPAPVFDPWNGFYVGAHGGYGWGDKKFVDNFPVNTGEVDAEPQLRGGLGGFQAGYNYRMDWLVLGIEADFSWSDLKQTNFSCFTFGDQICSAKSEWFATVAGRIGFANGPALLYLKGGPAWTRDRFTDFATCSGPQATSRNGVNAACDEILFAHQNRFGWLIGGGLEYLVANNWSLKLEYNYIDFGSRSVTFGDGETGFFTEQIHQKINVVKAGINYHFDGGSTAASQVRTRSNAFTAASNQQQPSRVLAFSGFDISKGSYSGRAGAFIAPFNNLDTSGLRLFILGEAGAYNYPGDTGSTRATYTTGDLLVGYAFEGDNYTINLLAGGNVANHMLSEIDTENSVQGTAFGGKVRADAWVNPTPKTLVYGEADYSTAFRTYYSKAKLGYDVTSDKQIFIGPEVAALGNERFDQWRLGAHVTQLKFGKIQADISGGYAHDSVVGNSAYASIEFSTNF